MMPLRVQMLTPVSAKCSWKRRMSSGVAVSGGALEKRSKTFAAANVASLRARTELAGVHVLDHPLAQWADGIRTHGQLLSWMRFTNTSILKTGLHARYHRSQCR